MKKITILAFFLLALTLGWSQNAVPQTKKVDRPVKVEMTTSMGKQSAFPSCNQKLHDSGRRPEFAPRKDQPDAG